MVSRVRVLLLGSLPPPYHGQSIAFKSVIDALKDVDKRVVEISFRDKNLLKSVKRSIKFFAYTFYGVIIYRPTVIYFLCSRTSIGSLRDIFMLLLAYRTPIRIVNHLHGSDFSSMFRSLSKWRRLLLKKLYSRVNVHVVLIDGMEEQLRCLGSNINTVVVPNFYSREANNYSPSQRFDSSEMSIIYLSSIVKTKGVFELINAVDTLVSRGCNVKLKIAGGFAGDSEMSEDAVAREFSRQTSGKAHISYFGTIDGDDKFRMLSESHVFVLPSYYVSEAVPLSVIEAMRMGCYVIVSDYKYLPTLVKDQINGSLVNARDPDDLQQKLYSVYKNRRVLEKISKDNIEYSISRFSEDSYQRKIRNLILDQASG